MVLTPKAVRISNRSCRLEQVSNVFHYRKILAFLQLRVTVEPTCKRPNIFTKILKCLKLYMEVCLGRGFVYCGKVIEIVHKVILQMGSK